MARPPLDDGEPLPSCAIMVLNWNGASWLERCLPSVVEAADEVAAEVWVVDNASGDESRDLCASRFPSVRFFGVGGNRVLAGYNVAAAECTAEIVVFLNNDLVVEKQFLAPLLTHFRHRPDLFAVAPCIRTFPPAETSPVEVEASRPVWQLGMLRGARSNGAAAGPTWYTSGGAMACRRAMFLELGGFDELFFPTYHDDVDLGWRAWKRGWSCGYEPGSTVYHAGGATMGRSARVRALMSRNELLFHWKNLGAVAIAVHGAMLLPRLTLRMLRGDWAGLRGALQAVRMWRAVARSRERALPLQRCSDGEIFRRFAVADGDRWIASPGQRDAAKEGVRTDRSRSKTTSLS